MSIVLTVWTAVIPGEAVWAALAVTSATWVVASWRSRWLVGPGDVVALRLEQTGERTHTGSGYTNEMNVHDRPTLYPKPRWRNLALGLMPVPKILYV